MPWMHIAKPGRVTRDGRAYLFGDLAFDQAHDNFEVPIVFDFDHQSTRVPPSRIPNCTLGLITGLATVKNGRVTRTSAVRDANVPPLVEHDLDDGQWAYFDAMPLGRKLLVGGNYKYTSMAFDSGCFGGDGKAINFAINSVAACNNPALDGLQPLTTFSNSNSVRLVALSTGGELRAFDDRSNAMPSPPRMISSSNAEFARLVAKKIKMGRTVTQAMHEVDAEHPNLYATPSNVRARRYDHAGERIPIGTPTEMPAPPLDARNDRNVHRPASTPKPTSDEYAGFEERYYNAARYYQPKHTIHELLDDAQIASGRAEAKYRERWARMPDVPISEFYVSPQRRSMIKFIISKMNDDGTYEIGPRLE